MKKSIWANVIYYFSWFCLALSLTGLLPPPIQRVGFASSAQGASPSWLRPMIWLLMILLVMVLIYWIFRTLNRPGILDRTLFKTIKVFLFLFFFGSGLLVYWLLGGIPKTLLGWITFASIGALVGILVTNRKRLNKRDNTVMWKMVILITAALCVAFCIPQAWDLRLPSVHLGGNLLEYYVAQLSLTFITISVMSVLSDKSVIIYWENVAEAKLIKPVFLSFAAYTAYSIASTVGAGIGVLMGREEAFAFFFLINVVVLIALTLTMVDVYYGRERKKRSRAADLRSAAEGYVETGYAEAPFTGISSFEHKKMYHYSGAEEYRDMMYNLQYHLYQEIQGHNLPYLKEVAELYGGNMDCFDSPEGKMVVDLLLTAPVDLIPMIVDGVDERVADMEQRHRGSGAMKKNFWYEDEALWKFLSKKSVLISFSKSAVFQTKLTKTVLDRLMLLWLDLGIFKPRRMNLRVYWKYPYYEIGASAGRVQMLFNDFMKEHGSESELISYLARVVCFLLQHADQNSVFLIAKHPVVWALNRHLEKFGLDEEEIKAWQAEFEKSYRQAP